MRLRGCVGGPSSPPSLNSWVTSGMSSNLSEPKLTHLTSELTCLSPHTALTQLKEMPGLSRVFEEDQRQLHEIAETRTKDSSSSSPCLGDSKAPSLTSEQGAAPHKDHLSIQDHPAPGLATLPAHVPSASTHLPHRPVPWGGGDRALGLCRPRVWPGSSPWEAWWHPQALCHKTPLPGGAEAPGPW